MATSKLTKYALRNRVRREAPKRGIETARGGRQLKLHAVETIADRREARPGPWKSFDSTRVSKARYDFGLEQIQVVFKDGTPWVYESVPRNVWRNMRQTASAGKYINRVLNGYPYRRGGTFLPGGEAGEDEDIYAPIDWQ